MLSRTNGEPPREGAELPEGDAPLAERATTSPATPVDMKRLSESDICDKFIRPAVQAAGWNGMDQICRELPLRAGRVVVRRHGKVADPPVM